MCLLGRRKLFEIIGNHLLNDTVEPLSSLQLLCVAIFFLGRLTFSEQNFYSFDRRPQLFLERASVSSKFGIHKHRIS
jgi:hypothetical protein